MKRYDPPVVEVVNEVDLVLQWVGFENAATHQRIQVEDFGTFVEATMKEKGIRDLPESYGRRTVGDGRFIVGIRRVRFLIGGLVHWVQDFARVNETPSILSYGEGQLKFRVDLEVAFQRADVRKARRLTLVVSLKTNESGPNGSQNS